MSYFGIHCSGFNPWYCSYTSDCIGGQHVTLALQVNSTLKLFYILVQYTTTVNGKEIKDRKKTLKMQWSPNQVQHYHHLAVPRNAEQQSLHTSHHPGNRPASASVPQSWTVMMWWNHLYTHTHTHTHTHVHAHTHTRTQAQKLPLERSTFWTPTGVIFAVISLT